MARSVYVTGIGRGDGRQVVELGVMELLSRRSGRVGVFRPLAHDGPDPIYDLLRSRYRLSQPAGTVVGLGYDEAAAVLAEKGTDELVSHLVGRFHTVARDYEAVLVLGTDYADTGLPAELALNARLANEFGASVLPVVAGTDHEPEALAAEVRNAHHAYASLGCDVIAMLANRVPDGHAAEVARVLGGQLPVPVYVLPEDPALAAPTVSQVVDALGAEVLQGDPDGLARDVRGFVFGGATLPTFLPALTEGCMVITPGDRADLVVGSLAAHAAGSPAIAGVLLTTDRRPGEETMALAARLSPGTPVLAVSAGSFPTAAELMTVEGRLTTATPRKAEIALGLFESHVDTGRLAQRLSVVRSGRVTPMMFEHELIERSRSDRRHIVLPEGSEERVLRAAEVLLRRGVCDLTLLGDETAIRKRVAELGLDLGLLEPDEVFEGQGASARVVNPEDSPLRERFAGAIAKHPLRREIVATVVVNEMVDFGSATFAFRLAEEIGATTDDAVRAFTAAVDIFRLRDLWHRIRTTPMPTAVRDRLEQETNRVLERGARSLLLNRPQPIVISADIARYRDGVRALADQVPAWLPAPLSERVAAQAATAADDGAPLALATEVYHLIQLFPLLDVLDIADIAERDAHEVAELYFALNAHLEITRLIGAVGDLDYDRRWAGLARLALRDDLYESLRLLTLDIASATDPEDLVSEKLDYWEQTNRSRLARARATLTEIFGVTRHDLATLSVAARQVRSLAGTSESATVV